MNSDIVLREYKNTDYKDIIQAGYPFTTSDWGNAYKDLKRKIVTITEKTKDKRFVAYSTRDRKAIGIVILKGITSSLWLMWHIFVSPKHRRRGISLLLYRTMFDYLRKMGVRKVVAHASTDIALMKGLEKMWDGFLSQKIYEYSGNIPRIENKDQNRIITRRFYPSDKGALYKIFRQCANDDWYSVLEIDESNFLYRFVGYIRYRGILRILFRRQPLVFEDEDGSIKGYAIVPLPRLFPPSKALVKFFVSPQLSRDGFLAIINQILIAMASKGFKKVSMSTIHPNEKLLIEMSQILRRDFRFEISQYTVPLKEP